jgi:hypothetical protein
MLWRLVVANGLALAGIGYLALGGAQLTARPVVDQTLACEFDSLEIAAAQKRDAGSITSLAGAYLERDQPGLATTVIESASSEVRQRPEVAQLHARALFGRGHAREALAVARGVADSCDPDVADHAPCPAWLVAKSTRQLAFLEEVVAAGIDDPQADPAATMAAYERSSREVRLVAMR